MPTNSPQPQIAAAEGSRPSAVSRALLPVMLMGSAMLALAGLSGDLLQQVQTQGQPHAFAVLAAVALMVLAGGAFLVLAPLAPGLTGWSGGVLIALVFVALRLPWFAAPPVLQDDVYRYLWDGLLVTHSQDPYAYAPQEAVAVDSLSPLLNDPDVRDAWSQINHPELRTIYPPTAQAAFAAAAWLDPAGLNAWRGLLVALEVLLILVLGLVLSRLGRSVGWVALYACNPLAAVQIIGGAHMDVLALLLSMMAIHAAMGRRFLWSAGYLALAVGAKVYPLLLLPILLRPIWFRPKRMLPALLIFGVITGAMTFAVVRQGMGPSSGFSAYAERWTNNSLVFPLHQLAWESILPGESEGHIEVAAKRAARLTAVGLLGALVLGLSLSYRQPRREGQALAHEQDSRSLDPWARRLPGFCLAVTAALFLLSPTQFPWYYTWLLPMLVLVPAWPLLAYVMLLGLYDLWAYPEIGDGAMWAVVGVQHAPVLLGLLGVAVWAVKTRIVEGAWRSVGLVAPKQGSEEGPN